MTGSPKTVKNARETLLRHRLSNPYDTRVVSTCELMIIEFETLEALPNADAEDPRCQAILREARSRLDTWGAEWNAFIRESTDCTIKRDVIVAGHSAQFPPRTLHATYGGSTTVLWLYDCKISSLSASVFS
jgi:hypothetical protein